MAKAGCPVCNGFSSLNVSCPDCGEWMEDRGDFSILWLLTVLTAQSMI